MSTRSAWMSIRARRAHALASKANASTPAQITKTVLLVFLWLGFSPVYVRLIATYDRYLQAQTTVVGLAIFGGIAVHLWPTRTPPWRTIAWTMFLMMWAGMILLSLDTDRIALTGATITGFAVVLLRVNQNWTKLRELISTWRALR